MSDAKIKNMEEFAAISGISRPTVSKYFHDPDSVRASTRERIEKALQDHDYRPNIYAVNQNRKLTKNIGIVVPYLADPFFAELARNAEQRCIDAGFRPTLYSAHGNPSVEVEILESLRVLKPAGVLMAPLGRSSDRAVVEKFCADVPTVLFDSELPDLGVPYIGSDNAQFARLIVDYLSRTGEPPCFLEMKYPANPNANKRRQGYIKAVEALGLTPHVVSIEGEGWSIEEIARIGGAKAIAKGAFATRSVLCSNDRLAIGFLVACYESNLTVGIGNDAVIRVSGMDDHPFSRFTCPPLTTVAQDYESISRHAVDALFGAIEGIENPQNRILFEGKLIMRQSA